MLLLGLDIGGTKSAAIVGSSSGEIRDRLEWPSRAERGPGPMIHDIVGHARALLARHPGVCSVGVAIGGPLDGEQGVILSPPNLPGWHEIPLKSILYNALSLPVHIEHDAAACAMAEALWGGGVGKSRVIYLTCGTGMGMGLVIDGKSYKGAGGRYPEVGHWRYADTGPTAYDKLGSFEAFTAGGSLPSLASHLFPHRFATGQATGPHLRELATKGDADARAVIDANARATGRLCALLGDLFVPDVILLGSLARYFGSSWVQAVRLAFELEVLPQVRERSRIEPAALGTALQDCSALAASLRCGTAGDSANAERLNS